MNTLSKRMFAIGDIHGCADELNHLLAWIAPTADDVFVFLGDMIDRGDDSKGVLDSIMNLKKTAQVICIMGNHEQMLLASCSDKDILRAWLHHGGEEALASFGLPASQKGVLSIPEHYMTFLTSCQDYYQTDAHIFCHATPRANVDIADFTDNDLRWRKLFDTQRPHISDKTIICGHTAQRSGDVYYQPGLVCIDTFAYGGGWLTALEISANNHYQAWQVNQLSQQNKMSIELW